MKFVNSITKPFIPLIAVALLAIAGSAPASTDILAGWHDFSSSYGLCKTSASTKSAGEYLGGISASLYGGDGSRNIWGSTDSTYGV